MPQRLTYMAESSYRVILEYDVRCWLALGKRDWNYTRHDCRRYTLLNAYVFSADQVSHIQLTHPPSDFFIDDEDL